MSNLNLVCLQGNLVADAEIVGKDDSVAKFTIAVNNGFGEHKETAFVDCVAFGKQVAVIGEYFKKGKQIIVRGSLRQNRYETKEGEKRSKFEVKLDTFDGFSFAGSPAKGDGEPAGAASDKPAPEGKKGKEKEKLF